MKNGAALRGVERTVLEGDSQPEEFVLETGEKVIVDLRSAELRDAEGRLMLRYEGGRLVLAATAGDVVFAAPSGRVVFEAGQDIAFSAGRDVVHRSGRNVSLAAGEGCASRVELSPAGARFDATRLDLNSEVTHGNLGDATVTASALRTRSKTWSLVTERFEVTATRIIERAQESLREIAELAESRVGRARTLVRDAFTLHTRRTTMVSTEDTRVDGKRIHLG